MKPTSPIATDPFANAKGGDYPALGRSFALLVSEPGMAEIHESPSLASRHRTGPNIVAPRIESRNCFLSLAVLTRRSCWR